MWCDNCKEETYVEERTEKGVLMIVCNRCHCVIDTRDITDET